MFNTNHIDGNINSLKNKEMDFCLSVTIVGLQLHSQLNTNKPYRTITVYACTVQLNYFNVQLKHPTYTRSKQTPMDTVCLLFLRYSFQSICLRENCYVILT